MRDHLRETYGFSDEQLDRIEADIQEAKQRKLMNREVLWSRYVQALLSLPLNRYKE
jgi:hypothetical protein